MATEANLLRVESLSKRFGGVAALDGVNVDVPSGLIYGLIGPNGSGKTTLFNTITGFLKPDSGTVTFAGRTVTGLSPDAIARAGLVRTFQASLCPTRMTVMENMLLAPFGQVGEQIVNIFVRPGSVQRQERAHRERARELLAVVKLADKADEYAGSLSGGQRKLLTLAQALMAKPRLVLLDEPVAGVNPRLIEEIAEVIRRFRQEGHNFLIVEHNMTFIRMICEYVSVLDTGRVIASGPAADVLRRDDVLRAYLGHHGGGAGEPMATGPAG